MGLIVKAAFSKLEGTDIITVFPLVWLLSLVLPSATRNHYSGVVYSENYKRWFWSLKDYHFCKGQLWGQYVENSLRTTEGNNLSQGVGQLLSVRGFDFQSLVDKMAREYPHGDVVAMFDFHPEDVVDILSRLPGVDPSLATSEVIFFECRSAKKADQLAKAIADRGLRVSTYSLGVRVSE